MSQEKLVLTMNLAHPVMNCFLRPCIFELRAYLIRIISFSGLQECKKNGKGSETNSISREEQKKACDIITKQLRTFRANVVCNVMGIPAARVPIVKFVHMKTGLSCDLSFKNPMAVMNTEFIRMCVQADSRIRTVMVAIRYWAATYGLSGGGRGGRTWKITNYALTMLIIFYMQVISF